MPASSDPTRGSAGSVRIRDFSSTAGGDDQYSPLTGPRRSYLTTESQIVAAMCA